MNVNYRVQWHTRNGVHESVRHEGRMIGILPGRPASADPEIIDYGQLDRAVIIERDPPNELSGTRFKVVDLSDLTVLGPWEEER